MAHGEMKSEASELGDSPISPVLRSNAHILNRGAQQHICMYNLVSSGR
jgi:hypothetical protein